VHYAYDLHLFSAGDGTGFRQVLPCLSVRGAVDEAFYGGILMANLTVKQVAELLAVSVESIYQLCAKRILAHIRIGAGRGTIRIPEESLKTYLMTAAIDAEETPAPKGREPGKSQQLEAANAQGKEPCLDA
jgi:excisionase family DNA binding protein